MKHIFRFHIIGTVVALLLFLGVWIVFGVLQQGIAKRQGRVLEVRDRLASFEQNKRIFSDEVRQLDIIKTRITTLERYIITEESIPGLLSSLEGIATNRGVDFEITSVNTVTDTSQGQNEKILRIDFSATGSLASLQALVKNIESESYKVVFRQFSLFLVGGSSTRSVSAQPSAGQWQLLGQLDILSY